MNLEKIKWFPDEPPTDLINCIMIEAKHAELEKETLVSRVLTAGPLSDACKNYLIEKLRQEPNLTSLDDMLQRLHASQSDDVNWKAASLPHPGREQERQRK